MRTANINIADGLVEFDSPVLGAINSPIDLEHTEIIDAVWMHLATESGVHMISVLQYSFNGKEFNSTSDTITIDGFDYDVITYLESL